MGSTCGCFFVWERKDGKEMKSSMRKERERDGGGMGVGVSERARICLCFCCDDHLCAGMLAMLQNKWLFTGVISEKYFHRSIPRLASI